MEERTQEHHDPTFSDLNKSIEMSTKQERRKKRDQLVKLLFKQKEHIVNQLSIARLEQQSPKEILRLLEMEKQITRLIGSVKDNNYMLMQQQGSEEDETIRSQVVATSPFSAFIHRGANK